MAGVNVRREGTGSHERLANFTESSDILSDFPWAERREAKVRSVPQVLIRGILPRGGAGLVRLAGFTENADILSDFPWSDACEAKVRSVPQVLIGGILPPGGSAGGPRCGAMDASRYAVGFGELLTVIPDACRCLPLNRPVTKPLPR